MKKVSLLILVLLLASVGLVQAQDNLPANDSFANATTITFPYDATIVDFEDAGSEVNEPNHTCSLAEGTLTVWYKFTIDVNSIVTLNTLGSDVGTLEDTVMSVYSGTGLGALTSVACNDDPSQAGVFTASISADLNAGTYYVQVSNAGSTAPTTATIHLTGSAVPSSVDYELLENVSFEDKNPLKPSQPALWNPVPSGKDKLLCGLEEGDFSRTGLCSYRFVGGEEERAKLSFLPDLTGVTSAQGDELTARLYYETNDVTPKLKVKVTITYTDPNIEPGKYFNTINTLDAGDFTGIGFEPYPLAGPVSSIKFQLMNKAIAGKIYVDDVSLILTHQLAR